MNDGLDGSATNATVSEADNDMINLPENERIKAKIKNIRDHIYKNKKEFLGYIAIILFF